MSTNGAHANGAGITEDEAALYDRQIRLWGVEAQNSMRKASVLVVTLRGLATEVCKNIVLAGIGSLTLLDDQDVSEEDLGSGYFYRDEEVGSKRAQSALPRIQALNPRVAVSASNDMSLLSNLEEIKKFTLVCLTDSNTDTISQVNDLCRIAGVQFYAASSLGLSGYIFADLLDHEYTLQRPDPKAKIENGMEPPKIPVSKKQSFVPFSQALQHSWSNAKPALRKKQLPRMTGLFDTLILLAYQAANGGKLPTEESEAEAMFQIGQKLLPSKGIDAGILNKDRLESLCLTATTDFSPSCAVVGGVLAQDILNALGGREAPLVNFFVFDGEQNSGSIYNLNVTRT